jgi:peptidoglycan/LPS O-acetylase OafA/YrhL
MSYIPKKNNFDLLRFLFAITVFLVHSYQLSGTSNLALFKFIEVFPLAIIVIYFACIFQNFGNFAKYGDFSYGIYILHFPILQALVQSGLFNSNPCLAFCLALILVLVGAFLLWHLVEKHFLQKSSHYLAKMK